MVVKVTRDVPKQINLYSYRFEIVMKIGGAILPLSPPGYASDTAHTLPNEQQHIRLLNCCRLLRQQVLLASVSASDSNQCRYLADPK